MMVTFSCDMQFNGLAKTLGDDAYLGRVALRNLEKAMIHIKTSRLLVYPRQQSEDSKWLDLLKC